MHAPEILSQWHFYKRIICVCAHAHTHIYKDGWGKSVRNSTNVECLLEIRLYYIINYHQHIFWALDDGNQSSYIKDHLYRENPIN